MTKTIVFVGDVGWDTAVLAERMPDPDEKIVAQDCVEDVGGVTANAAIACSLAGGNVILYASIAEDASGVSVRRALATRGIDARLSVTKGPTTRAVIFLDDAGEKRLFLIPGASMYPDASTISTLPLDGIHWVHTALYDHAISASLIERCRRARIPWSIDLEPATMPPSVEDLAPHIAGCQTVILNARAREALGELAVQSLLDMGAHEVIETLGPRGVRLHRLNTVTTTVEPTGQFGAVIDTTGAGDAFAGWYIAERVNGTPIQLALERAVNAASHSVRFLGASASYLPRAALQDFLPSGTNEERSI